jgi:hypothetical protein
MTIKDLEKFGVNLTEVENVRGGRIILKKGDLQGVLHGDLLPPFTISEIPEADPEKYHPLPGSTFFDCPAGQEPQKCHALAREMVAAWESLPGIQDAATAADLNNMGCAYVWSGISWEKAVDLFTKALEKSPSKEQKEVIEANKGNAEKVIQSQKHNHFEIPTLRIEELVNVAESEDLKLDSRDPEIRNLIDQV